MCECAASRQPRFFSEPALFFPLRIMSVPVVPGGARKCPFCWNGLCKKHPLQDHGASMQFIDKQSKSDILTKLFEDRIGGALKKKLAEKEREDVMDAKEQDVVRVRPCVWVH